MAFESGILFDSYIQLSDDNYVSTGNTTYTQGHVVSGALVFSDGNYVSISTPNTYSQSTPELSGNIELSQAYSAVYLDKTYIGSEVIYVSALPAIGGDTGQIIEGGGYCLFTYRVNDPEPNNYTIGFFDRSAGDIQSWSWDFGDSGTSTEQNPTHVYTEGTYLVRLTITFTSNNTAWYETTITAPGITPDDVTTVRPQLGQGSNGVLYVVIPKKHHLDPIDPNKRRDEVIGGMSLAIPHTMTGVGRGGLYNMHGYAPGAMKFTKAIKQFREHVEFEKFLCRTITDDDRTRQFKTNTQEHPQSRYRLIYNNNAVEEHTAAGKAKRRNANRQ